LMRPCNHMNAGRPTRHRQNCFNRLITIDNEMIPHRSGESGAAGAGIITPGEKC